MAIHELPSFTTNNTNAAYVENGLSTADGCVCARERVLWYHKTKSMVRVQKKISQGLWQRITLKMST